MGLPPIGEPPEETCYDCFYACKAAEHLNKVGLGLESGRGVGLGVRVSFTVRFSVSILVFGVRVIQVGILSYNCVVRQHAHVKLLNEKLYIGLHF